MTRSRLIRSNFLTAILFILVSYKCYCEEGYLLLCESQMENVVCPMNSTINVIKATYGYNTSNEEARQECDDWWNKYFRDLDSTNCHHPDSTYIVADKCNGLLQCTISASNEMFGDPCRGVTKYFELYYNCSEDKGENEVPTITPNTSGEEGGDDKLDEGRGGGERDGYSSNGNSKGPDDRVQTTTDGYKVTSDSSCENSNNSDGIQTDNEIREGNDDHHDNDDNEDEDDDSDDDNDGDDDDDDDGDCDDENQKGLSAVAIVAIAAGIPIGVVITIAIIVILTCILASSFKRRKKLGRTDYRNMSANQYDGQGCPMTASSNNEDSEMVYNSAYQSVSKDGQSADKTMGNDKIDGMRINYENLSEAGSTNESANTNEEEAVYNEAYQSINSNEPKR